MLLRNCLVAITTLIGAGAKPLSGDNEVGPPVREPEARALKQRLLTFGAGRLEPKLANRVDDHGGAMGPFATLPPLQYVPDDEPVMVCVCTDFFCYASSMPREQVNERRKRNADSDSCPTPWAAERMQQQAAESAPAAADPYKARARRSSDEAAAVAGAYADALRHIAPNLPTLRMCPADAGCVLRLRR